MFLQSVCFKKLRKFVFKIGCNYDVIIDCKKMQSVLKLASRMLAFI